MDFGWIHTVPIIFHFLKKGNSRKYAGSKNLDIDPFAESGFGGPHL